MCLLLRHGLAPRHLPLPLLVLLRRGAVLLGLGLDPGHLVGERGVLRARGVELGGRLRLGALQVAPEQQRGV